MQSTASFGLLLFTFIAAGCSSPPDPGGTPNPPSSQDAAPDVAPSTDAGKQPDTSDAAPAADAGSDDASPDVTAAADADAGPQGTPCVSDLGCATTEACPGLAWLEGANQVCTPADQSGGPSCAAAPSPVVVDHTKIVYLDYAFDSSSTRTDNVSCSTNPPATWVEQVLTVDLTVGGNYEIWSNDDAIAVLEGTQCPGTCNNYVGPQVTTGGTLGAQTLHIIVFHNPNNAPRGHVEIIPD